MSAPARLPDLHSRATFDREKVLAWLRERCGPEAENCDIQPDYEPRLYGWEDTTRTLVEEAFNTQEPAVQLPPGYWLSYTFNDDSDGGSYTFLLDVQTGESWNRTRLADYWHEQRKIGDSDVLGFDAAAAIVEEATFAANHLLAQLEQLVTALAPTPPPAGSDTGHATAPSSACDAPAAAAEKAHGLNPAMEAR